MNPIPLAAVPAEPPIWAVPARPSAVFLKWVFYLDEVVVQGSGNRLLKGYMTWNYGKMAFNFVGNWFFISFQCLLVHGF